MTIGILGGYGNVGSAAARQLLNRGQRCLRIGGRDAGAARRFVETLAAPDVDHRRVDFRDEASLRRFAEGCSVLLNCAGPSHAIGDRVAKAALQAGIDLVDAAGDDALHAALDPNQYRHCGRTAVLSAGLQPGLTGLLPRWAAQRMFSQVDRMSSYFGLLDHFTEVAADDYLQGAADQVSEPLAAWRGGVRRSGVLTRQRQVQVPLFPGTATLLPYLSTEGERLARSLQLTHGDWHTVLAGPQVLAAFDRSVGLERREAAAALRRASLLDLSGRDPYVLLVVQLDGVCGGIPATRTVVLRGKRNAELTGAMAALTTLAVLRNEVPQGCHFAADILEPASVIEHLCDGGAVASLGVLDTAIESLSHSEEGTL